MMMCAACISTLKTFHAELATRFTNPWMTFKTSRDGETTDSDYKLHLQLKDPTQMPPSYHRKMVATNISLSPS